MLCGPFALVALVASTSVMDAPDPRPAHHVVDLTGTLTFEDIAAIDASAQSASANGELVVVVVPSTDGANPREWTTAYFNRLRVDTTERNRGVVLMAAINDRKAEIVIGEGYPGSVTTDTDSIMASVVVAHFKSRDPRGAMVEGARALTTRVIASAAVAPVAPLVEVAPVVDPAVVAASTSEAVLKVPDPRAVDDKIVDIAGVLAPIDRREVQIATEQMTDGMSLVTIIVADTAPLTPRVFAEALAHRFDMTNPNAASANTVLLFVVAGKATPPPKAAGPKAKAAHKAKLAKVEPAIEVLLGAALPREALNVDSIAAGWRSRAALDRKAPNGGTLGLLTGSAARALSMLGMDLSMYRFAQARAAEEQASRDAAARAQLAAQQATAQETRDDGQAFFDDDNPLAWGTGGAGLFGLFLTGREVLRRRPRSCKKCNVRMHRLAEEVDDKHLQAGEQTEERLGSVDYDVWACAQCGDVLKTRWGALFTSFSRCGGCSWKTMSSTSRTISAATTSSTGLAEVTEDCKHCSHHRTYTRVIPRVQKSSSSSSGGSSRGGGGGFSSGRGSSGSW